MLSTCSSGHEYEALLAFSSLLVLINDAVLAADRYMGRLGQPLPNSVSRI